MGDDVTMARHIEAEIETAHVTVQAMRARGIRVIPFGEYGFAFNPHGTDARELGEIKPGYLADLLLVDGDPSQDVTLLQDADNIVMIMKDGRYHKLPSPRRTAAGRVAAAE